jgi:hypothetical protein
MRITNKNSKFSLPDTTHIFISCFVKKSRRSQRAGGVYKHGNDLDNHLAACGLTVSLLEPCDKE